LDGQDDPLLDGVRSLDYCICGLPPAAVLPADRVSIDLLAGVDFLDNVLLDRIFNFGRDVRELLLATPL
jgi:hypothetical protein